MSGLNKVMLIGNVGSDPEIKYGQNGGAILRMSLATNERWKDRDGNQHERTEWHRLTVFGKRAEGLAKHVDKGTRLYVEGRIETRKWQDRDGNDRYTTEIVVSDVKFLGGPKREGYGDRRTHREERAPHHDDSPTGGFEDDSEIPF